jgi:hypothetical protein
MTKRSSDGCQQYSLGQRPIGANLFVVRFTCQNRLNITANGQSLRGGLIGAFQPSGYWARKCEPVRHS